MLGTGGLVVVVTVMVVFDCIGRLVDNRGLGGG
jgi:hypothetical protein